MIFDDSIMHFQEQQQPQQQQKKEWKKQKSGILWLIFNYNTSEMDYFGMVSKGQYEWEWREVLFIMAQGLI